MTRSENTKLNDFIEFYKIQYKKISDKEDEVESLVKETQVLLEELIVQRTNENIFIEKLKAKYGEETLNNEFNKLRDNS
jgi:hypothetical protein